MVSLSCNIPIRYNCNRYDEEEAKAARDAQEKSRAALQRYLFYCNRYMNHMQSLKFENEVKNLFFIIDSLLILLSWLHLVDFFGLLDGYNILQATKNSFFGFWTNSWPNA